MRLRLRRRAIPVAGKAAHQISSYRRNRTTPSPPNLSTWLPKSGPNDTRSRQDAGTALQSKVDVLVTYFQTATDARNFVSDTHSPETFSQFSSCDVAALEDQSPRDLEVAARNRRLHIPCHIPFI